jgi:hypothetical protein
VVTLREGLLQFFSRSCSREGLQWSSFFIRCLRQAQAAKKKRERKARPVVFTEGHAQINAVIHRLLFNDKTIWNNGSFSDNNNSFLDAI